MKEYKQTGLIICGFPGVGKSATATVAKERYHSFDFRDMESTPYRFTFEAGGGRFENPSFPTNYVDDIRQSSGPHGFKVTMVSCHQNVRNELKNQGLCYLIVVPERSLKEEYIRRYVVRGSDFSLIEQVYRNWDNWIDGLEKDGAPVIHLSSGEFLSDVIVPENY